MVLVIFPILMFIISLTLHKTMAMMIHNQYLDMELVSPVYFYDCGTHYAYPVERTNSGSTMKVDFRFDSAEARGILMYKVQRKETIGSDHPFDIDAKAIEEVSKRMRLLVAWKIERFRWPKVRIMLVEYDNEPIMNEDKLVQLHDKIYAIPFRVYDWTLQKDGIYESKWLMCDNTALMVTCELMRKESLALKITISKGFKDELTIRPIWIDSTRQV
jgi:hypothetical protein